MSDDFYVDTHELTMLARAFDTRAYDLSSAVKSFQGRTGAEQIYDGFGLLTESEEVTSAYIELAADMADSLEKVARHFDEVGQALKGNAKNSEASDDALADLFKGGRKQ